MSKIIAQDIIVSTPLSNVLFCGINNKLIFNISNNSCGDISIKAKDGILIGENCNYIYKTSEKYNCSCTICFERFYVFVDSVIVDSIDIRIKTIDDFVLDLDKFDLMTIPFKTVKIQSDFCNRNDILYNVEKFEVSIFNNGKEYYFTNSGADFENEILDLLLTMQINSITLNIYNIFVKYEYCYFIIKGPFSFRI